MNSEQFQGSVSDTLNSVYVCMYVYIDIVNYPATKLLYEMVSIFSLFYIAFYLNLLF